MDRRDRDRTPPEEWGAPAVAVSSKGDDWTIEGKWKRVVVNAAEMTVHVQAGSTEWAMLPNPEGADDGQDVLMAPDRHRL